MPNRFYSVTVCYFHGPKEKPGKTDPQVSIVFDEIKAASKAAAIQEVRDKIEALEPLPCGFSSNISFYPSMIGVYYSAEQVL